jgi:hypothetical protein
LVTAYRSLVLSLKAAHEDMMHGGGLVAAPTPIRSALRLVDGALEILQATFEGHGWRLRVVRDGREARSTRMSKWQQVECAFQIFVLRTASDVPDGDPEHAIRT